jgi:hypothetical protein
MPIILLDPPTTTTTAPSVYEIDGVSFHNMAEPTATGLDEAGNPVSQVRAYAVIEYRIGDTDAAGAFVSRQRGSVMIAGTEMLAWLQTPEGEGAYALLKRMLHEILVARGDFPVGYNVLSQTEEAALASLGGRLLNGA